MARLVSKHAQRSLLRGQEPRGSASRCVVAFRTRSYAYPRSTPMAQPSALWIVLLVVHLVLRSPGSDHAVSTGVTVEIAVMRQFADSA